MLSLFEIWNSSNAEILDYIYSKGSTPTSETGIENFIKVSELCLQNLSPLEQKTVSNPHFRDVMLSVEHLPKEKWLAAGVKKLGEYTNVLYMLYENISETSFGIESEYRIAEIKDISLEEVDEFYKTYIYPINFHKPKFLYKIISKNTFDELKDVFEVYDLREDVSNFLDETTDEFPISENITFSYVKLLMDNLSMTTQKFENIPFVEKASFVDLSNNEIIDFSDEYKFGDVTYTIDLSNNKIQTLNFENFSECHNKLYLSNNLISKIIFSGFHENLRFLDLHDNMLSEFDSNNIEKYFPALEHLDLSNNKIKEFDFSKIHNVEMLNISNNLLTQFTGSSLSEKSGILIIYVSGNPFENYDISGVPKNVIIMKNSILSPKSPLSSGLNNLQ